MPFAPHLLKIACRSVGEERECDGYTSKAKMPGGKQGLMVLTTSVIDVRTIFENSLDHSTSCIEENK
jgi:hypothetical protein